MALSDIGKYEAEAVAPEKLPTLRQWLSSRPKGKKFATVHHVTLIWFPGQWKNFTIETEVFRTRVHSSQPLYKFLEENAAELEGPAPSLRVEIVDARKLGIKLTLGTENGNWTLIGSSGTKFEAV